MLPPALSSLGCEDPCPAGDPRRRRAQPPEELQGRERRRAYRRVDRLMHEQARVMQEGCRPSGRRRRAGSGDRQPGARLDTLLHLQGSRTRRPGSFHILGPTSDRAIKALALALSIYPCLHCHPALLESRPPPLSTSPLCSSTRSTASWTPPPSTSCRCRALQRRRTSPTLTARCPTASSGSTTTSPPSLGAARTTSSATTQTTLLISRASARLDTSRPTARRSCALALHA